MDTTHADALNLRLSHERDRLVRAKTENERTLRRVWIAQIEKELAAEPAAPCELTDDELMAELLK